MRRIDFGRFDMVGFQLRSLTLNGDGELSIVTSGHLDGEPARNVDRNQTEMFEAERDSRVDVTQSGRSVGIGVAFGHPA